MTTAWLDRVAANLLHLETDLRTTLREISRGRKPPRLSGHHRLEITTVEARTILHGTMPAPIAVSRLREPHARLVAALNIFRSHLTRLNDPLALTIDPEFVLSAATTLIEELKVWHRIIRWKTACRRANVKIRCPETPRH